MMNNYPLLYIEDGVTYNDVGLTINCNINYNDITIIKTINHEKNIKVGYDEPYKTDDTFQYFKGSIKNCGCFLTNDEKLVIFDIAFENKNPLDNNYLPDNATYDDFNKIMSYKITNLRTVDKSFNKDIMLYRLYVRD